MSTRLMGQETEYAIRFTPKEDDGHPGNLRLYRALERAIRKLVVTRPEANFARKSGFFVENGGAFNYEALPEAPEGGLLEGSTPECAGPSEVVLFQRAQETLVKKAIPLATAELEKDGIRGELALIKNCRDAEGRVYGVQENYETTIATGFSLRMYQLSVILSMLSIALIGLPLFLLSGLLAFSYGLLSLIVPFLLPYGFRVRQAILEDNEEKENQDYPVDVMSLPDEGNLQRVRQLFYYCCQRISEILVFPVMLATNAIGFRSQKRALLPFLISRQIVTGGGSLRHNGAFALSERADALCRVTRFGMDDKRKSIFDLGNLYKKTIVAGIELLIFKPRQLSLLLRPRQRMQLGFSDANRAQVSEYLKFGTTALIMEMAESRLLEDVPRLADPLQAARQISGDSTLSVQVAVLGRDPMSALELQRFYLEKARQYLRRTPSVSMEYHTVVRMWGEVLHALETNPNQLVGRIDWVTKRFLLETAGAQTVLCGQEEDRHSLSRAEVRVL